jgi:hypothetical protein
MKNTKRWALAAVGVLLTAGVTTSVGSTSATVVPQFQGDTIVLELGPDGIPQVARYGAAGNLVTAIDLAVSKRCRVTNLHDGSNPVSQLLDIRVNRSTTTPVYLVENGLGTGASDGCKTGNGRISDGDSITFAAGSLIPASTRFLSTSVNVEGKFSVDTLSWSTTDADDSGEFDLVNASDNGSDSGNNDNDQVAITPASPFRSISFSPISADDRGQVAIDTGGDGGVPGSRSTVFQLGASYEYAVNCGQEQVEQGPPQGIDTIDQVKFLRLQNGHKADGECDLIGVSIAFESNQITENGEDRDVAVVDHTLASAAGVFQDPRARVTIVWKVALNEGAAARTQTELDIELDREVIYEGVAAQPVTYCTSYGAQDPQQLGVPLSPTQPLVPNDVYSDGGAAAHPAGQPWCLLSDSRVISGDFIIQTQVLDVYGDPKFF